MQIAVSGRVLRSTVLALGVVVLAGCSMFSSKNPRYDPQPLTEYVAGVSASTAWSVSIGSGGGSGFVHVVVGDSVYAAAPNGRVSQLALASVRGPWQASTYHDRTAGVGRHGHTTTVDPP